MAIKTVAIKTAAIKTMAIKTMAEVVRFSETIHI